MQQGINPPNMGPKTIFRFLLYLNLVYPVANLPIYWTTYGPQVIHPCIYLIEQKNLFLFVHVFGKTTTLNKELTVHRDFACMSRPFVHVHAHVLQNSSWRGEKKVKRWSIYIKGNYSYTPLLLSICALWNTLIL